jgi:hypothetical protein
MRERVGGKGYEIKMYAGKRRRERVHGKGYAGKSRWETVGGNGLERKCIGRKSTS